MLVQESFPSPNVFSIAFCDSCGLDVFLHDWISISYACKINFNAIKKKGWNICLVNSVCLITFILGQLYVKVVQLIFNRFDSVFFSDSINGVLEILTDKLFKKLLISFLAYFINIGVQYEAVVKQLLLDKLYCILPSQSSFNPILHCPIYIFETLE